MQLSLIQAYMRFCRRSFVFDQDLRFTNFFCFDLLGRRNLGNFEAVLVNSEAVTATTSSINHQSSQTTPNGSPYYEYSRFPTRAVSVYPQNNESFSYYLSLSPPGIGTTPHHGQSPRQCISPLLGRLNTSENSAFVKPSPGQNRMGFDDGINTTDGWPCEIKDGSNEAALALASLQHKKNWRTKATKLWTKILFKSILFTIIFDYALFDNFICNYLFLNFFYSTFSVFPLPCVQS